MNAPVCVLNLNDEWKPLQTLSPREYQIFLLLGDGLSAVEVAHYPGFKCSHKTVESHCTHIKAKLGINRLARLRVYAARFITIYGKPEIEQRVMERRLVFTTAKPNI